MATADDDDDHGVDDDDDDDLLHHRAHVVDDERCHMLALLPWALSDVLCCGHVRI